MKKILLRCLIFAGLSFGLVSSAGADTPLPVKPAPKDKCPVCGMFVAKYPDWVAEILYADGMSVFFDGAKDFFKYYFNIAKYHPRKSQNDIAAIYVTEYYDVEFIDALKAVYVIGSDVYGPMGRELIPFRTEKDAAEFMQDHSGKMMLRFEAINPALIATLD